MLNFIPDNAPKKSVSVQSEIPKEMDIFYRTEENFLPKNKSFKDLTPQEQKELKNKYRFDPLRNGIYQGITGLKGSI